MAEWEIVPHDERIGVPTRGGKGGKGGKGGRAVVGVRSEGGAGGSGYGGTVNNKLAPVTNINPPDLSFIGDFGTSAIGAVNAAHQAHVDTLKAQNVEAKSGKGCLVALIFVALAIGVVAAVMIFSKGAETTKDLVVLGATVDANHFKVTQTVDSRNFSATQTREANPVTNIPQTPNPGRSQGGGHNMIDPAEKAFAGDQEVTSCPSGTRRIGVTREISIGGSTWNLVLDSGDLIRNHLTPQGAVLQTAHVIRGGMFTDGNTGNTDMNAIQAACASIR